MIRRALVAASLLAAAMTTGARAQDRQAATPGVAPKTSPATMTATSDVAGISTLIRRVYAAISGPAGPRDWDAFKALFVPEARLVPVGGKGPLVLDVQGYIDRAGPVMMREGFYESEISRRIDLFGNVAHVFSTYESRHAPGEAPFARGINSIQLVRTPAGWRVLHIVWQGETPTLPIPGGYLPAPGKR